MYITRGMSYKKRSKKWSSLHVDFLYSSFLIFYDGFGLVVSYLAFKKTCGVVDLRSSDALRRKTENDYAQ